jgi:hypothetical protein
MMYLDVRVTFSFLISRHFKLFIDVIIFFLRMLLLQNFSSTLNFTLKCVTSHCGATVLFVRKLIFLTLFTCKYKKSRPVFVEVMPICQCPGIRDGLSE